MWEFTIKTDSKTGDYITYLYNKMKRSIVTLKGQIAIAKINNENILSIAVPLDKKEKAQNLLRVYLCDIFCEKMKGRFLESHISCIPFDSDLFFPFVKVCTYFDNELERQIVMRSLKLEKGIMLPSYLEFYLRPLKNKWQELCNLTNENSSLFFESETFLELLKFLLANLTPKCECVIVSIKDNCIIFEDENGEMNTYQYEEKLRDVEVISKLIELSPQKIVLKMPNKSLKVVDNIVRLFDNRVEIIKN